METKPRVLVTGAAKRIGRVIAIEPFKQGFEVAIHYNRSRDEAQEVADQCGGAPTFQADLGRVPKSGVCLERSASALDC